AAGQRRGGAADDRRVFARAPGVPQRRRPRPGRERGRRGFAARTRRVRPPLRLAADRAVRGAGEPGRGAAGRVVRRDGGHVGRCAARGERDTVGGGRAERDDAGRCAVIGIGRRRGGQRRRRRRPGDVPGVASESEALRIGVLHGPNLNLLGRREPEVYGRVTLEEIDRRLVALGVELGVEVECHQANGEGELVDRVQELGDRVAGFVVNAGAYTHTSIALLDALVGVGLPFIEVHLSNIHAREAFRRRSLLAHRAVGVVCGFGAESYLLGLRGLVARLRERV